MRSTGSRPWSRSKPCHGFHDYLKGSIFCSAPEAVRGTRWWLTDGLTYVLETFAHGMHVPSEHRLNTMTDDLGQIRVIDAGHPQVRDIAVAALVGADV